MKKRNISLAIVLVVLCVISVVLFVASRETNSPKTNPNLFKVDASDKIDRVVLKRKQQTISLAFENGKWRVNESWDADAKMIKVFFATILQVEPRRPVAANMTDTVRRELERNGVHVSLSEGGIEKMSFLAGGNPMKTEAWFLKDGDDQPYVMTIPGYRVYVSGIFELDESGWRNKRVFDFNWRNFRSLVATYATESDQNFEIEMRDGYFGIRNVPQVDTTKLNDYLDAVSLLFATRFLPQGSAKSDSLAAARPSANITITDIGRRVYTLDLFAPRKRNDEIYGRLGSGEFIVLAKDDVAEIMRRRDYFVPRPAR
ncbi:MAG TPA: DUF4340 domain-containing protein [Cyclobacteriaceae bacterium]|nr:DUF4340 domain-containing protein [Cyclobacteriaceae bacterium]